MVEEYTISYCLFLTTIMIASDNWLNLFKNDFKLRQIYSGRKFLRLGIGFH